MKFALILVVLLTLAACLGTLALTGKSDENYRGAYKANTFRLTAIYAVVIIGSLAVLGWYISTL